MIQDYFDEPEERGVVSITKDDITDVATVLSQEPCYFREIIRKVNSMRGNAERGMLKESGILVNGNGKIQPGVVAGCLLHLQNPEEGTPSMPQRSDMGEFRLGVPSYPEVGSLTYRSFQIFVLNRWLQEESYVRKLDKKREIIVKASKIGFKSAQKLESALGTAVKRVFGGFEVIETGINEPKPDILIPALRLCFEISGRCENRLDKRYVETKSNHARGYKTIVIGQDFTEGAIDFAKAHRVDLITYPRQPGILLNSKEHASIFHLLGRSVQVRSFLDSVNDLEKIVSDYHLINLASLRAYLAKNIELLKGSEKFFRESSKELRAQIRKERGVKRERLKHELMISERQREKIKEHVREFRKTKERDLNKLYYRILDLKLAEIQYLSGLTGAVTRYFPKRKDWKEKIHETRVAVSEMRRQLKAYEHLILK